MRLTANSVLNAPTIPCDMQELGNKWTAWQAVHERMTVHLIRTIKEMTKMFCEGVTTRYLLKCPSTYMAVSNYTYRCMCRQRFSPEFVSLQSSRHVESQGVQLHTQNAFWEVNISQIFDRFHAFYVEYIYGFVRWGGLRAKSMTSQRAEPSKMAGMRYHDNVMTTTRWRLYVTMETLRQQQDGGYALLWYIVTAKVDWACYRCILHLQQYSHRLNLFFLCNL